MATFKILFFDRYSNPFDAMPYSKEVDFEAATVAEAAKELKKAATNPPVSGDIKAYLLKHNPKAAPERSGRVRLWKWIKVAFYPDRDSRAVKVQTLKQPHNENTDHTIGYHYLGRRNF